MFRIPVFAVILNLAVQCQSKFCCYPVQWEGTEGTITWSADYQGDTSVTIGNAKISYDVIGQRFYQSQKMKMGNISREYQVLQLYKQNIEYYVEDGECITYALPTYDPKLNCLPDNATAGSPYILGRKQNMLVTDYTWTRGESTITLTMNDDCVPIASKGDGPVYFFYVRQSMGYLGLTAGIKDPSVFNVPPLCTGTVEKLPELPFHRFNGPMFPSTVFK